MGTRFLWDPVEDNIVKELDDSNATLADYTTEPYLYGDLIIQDRSGQSRFYQFDGQGSTMELTDNSGNVTDTRRYSAFGETTESTGATVFSFQYLGQKEYYRHQHKNRYFVRRREYGAVQQRWLSRDVQYMISILNGYMFLHNQFMTLVDYSGNDDCPVDEKDKKLTCEEFIKAISTHKKYLKELHTSLEKIFACNVDIYCGKCEGFQGYTWIDPPSRPRWGHICLNDSLENTMFYWVGLLIHEAFHFIQFDNRVTPRPCPDKEFMEPRGTEPPPVGGPPTKETCNKCKEYETRAYLHQAVFHFPGPKCATVREVFVEWGLAVSCAAACKGIEMWDVEGKWAKFRAVLEESKKEGCDPSPVKFPEAPKK